MNTLDPKSVESTTRDAGSAALPSRARRLLCVGAAVMATLAGPAQADQTDALIKAVKFDDARTVQKLLDAGLDPNTTTRDNRQLPLIVLAAREKSDNVAKLLIDNPKTDIEKLDGAGENAMMLAALQGDAGLVRKLIDKGAEVNKHGWAPLHYAASNGHDDIVQLLVDNSAYVDAASPNGTTPLMMAARGNYVSTMKLLLDAGADPRLKNQIGFTALGFAEKYDAKDALEALEDMFARDDRKPSSAAGKNDAK